MSGRQLPHRGPKDGPRVWQRLAFASLVVLSGVTWARLSLPAASQSGSNAPSVEIPAEIRVSPASVTRLHIRVTLPSAMSRDSMIVLRGFPARVMLSEGSRFGADVWAVPLTSLGKLEIAPATGTSGTSDITVELTTLEGKVLATATSVLRIAPEPAAAEAQAGKATEPGGPMVYTTGQIPSERPQSNEITRQSLGAAAARRLSGAEIEKARALMARGDQHLAEGKITSARLLYQAAAEAGWAPGALALAGTYDSRQLARSQVMGGVQPDLALAKKWYEKASELGSAEAISRLQAMGTR
jgi:hypothetical protein